MLTWFPALDPDDSCLAWFHKLPTILSKDFVIKFSAGNLAPWNEKDAVLKIVKYLKSFKDIFVYLRLFIFEQLQSIQLIVI